MNNGKDGGETVEYTGTYDSQRDAKITLKITLRFPSEDQFVVVLNHAVPSGGQEPTMETT